MESSAKGIGTLTLSISFSILKVVKMVLLDEKVSVDDFVVWGVGVYVWIDFIACSIIVVDFEGLPGPNLGLKSYLLFNSAIRNS